MRTLWARLLRNFTQCVLCGSKGQHRAGDGRRLPLRHLPQPESILDETGYRVLCAIAVIYFVRSCWNNIERIYARSTETIMQALTAKVSDLKEKLHTSGVHEEIHVYCPFSRRRNVGRSCLNVSN